MARSDFKLHVPDEVERSFVIENAAAVRADRRRTRDIDPGKHIATARSDRHDKSGLEPCEEVLLKLRGKAAGCAIHEAAHLTQVLRARRARTDSRRAGKGCVNP